MAAIKKAGIPFWVKVDTQKDLIGKPSGFKVEYINDATGEAVEVDTTFEEIIKAVNEFSTTATDAVAQGEKEIPVTDASGFKPGDVVKINGNYYYIDAVDTDSNKITLAKSLVTAVAKDDEVKLVGNTGIYKAKVTINDPGDYTIVVSNYTEGMQNVAFPITVEEASIDDVKTLLDAIKPEIDSIKSQIDALDEEELNNLHEEIVALTKKVEHIDTLLSDVEVHIKVAGDHTDLAEGTLISGVNSNAEGELVKTTYDSDNDVTTLVLSNVKGEFDAETPEHIEDENGNDLGEIKELVKVSSVIDSIVEFAKQLKAELEDSATGLDAIIKYEKDIEHLINGDETLEDGSECPTKGKGLVAIFDEIVATHNDVSDIKTLAEDSTYGFQALRTAIDDARASIEAKIDALTDENDENSLASKLNAIKNVVDANKSLLENDTYGLSALKDLLDSDMNTIISRFDSVDTSLQNAVSHIDDRFDEVLNKLQANEEKTKFNVFA